MHLLVAIAILLVVSPAATAQELPLPEMRRQLREAVALGRRPWPKEAWPGAGRARCSRVIDEHALGYDELWCEECVVALGGSTARYRFHPDLDAQQCTLQEMRVELGPGHAGLLRSLEPELAHLGPATLALPDELALRGSWTRALRWALSGDLAWLFVDARGAPAAASPPRQAHVGFLWRRSPLIELTAEHPDDGLRRDLAFPPSTLLPARRDAGLGDDAAVVEALGSGREDLLVAEVHSGLERLAAMKPSGRRSALAYWLAGLLATHGSLPYRIDPQRLAAWGVTLEGGRDEAELWPALLAVGSESPSTKWGQRCLLELVRAEGDGPLPGQERFRLVVARVEPFLRAHPGSWVEPELVRELAVAYETWWSLAKTTDAAYDPEEVASWRPGAGRARRRALELYRRLRARDEHERTWLRQRIFRLERDIDTVQRRYGVSTC